MDTPPNFFGDAAAGLDASAMVGDESFLNDSNTIDTMPQYADAASGAFAPDAPPQTNAWGVALDANPFGGPLLPAADEDVKPMPRRGSQTTTRTKPTIPRASTSMSSSLTGTKSSRASSDASVRTRKSLSSQSTAPDEPESSNSKGKKSKKTTRAVTPEPVEEGKRSKFLERNRVAASKCRQRKKEWMSGLQDSKNELESRHQQLQLEHSALVGEVSSLKNQLMSHANCEDPNINLWIENEARRFVQSEAGRVSISQVMQGHVGPGMPQMAMRRSFNESTPGASPLALDPSMSAIQPNLKVESTDEINYDHMPDSIFQEDMRNLAG